MTIRWEDKDPGDIIVVEFDFTKDLGALTAVTAPQVSIAVAVGADPSASAMLVGQPQMIGGQVLQRIQAGVSGCDYALQCTASIGQDRLTIEAILPVRLRPIVAAGSPVYLTEAQFEQRFGSDELRDLLEGGTSYVRAENDAASLIDGYLATRYALPLASVPAIVRGLAADITRFHLWDERAPEEVRRRYDDAIARLRDLASAKLDLPPNAQGTSPTASAFNADGYSAERLFTSETLAGF